MAAMLKPERIAEPWAAIERAARDEALLALDAAEANPPVYGDLIAWAEQRFARTDALSPVHRVGTPQQGEPYTACGERIPAPVQWLVLSPGLVRTMPRCRFCETEYFRELEQQAVRAAAEAA